MFGKVQLPEVCESVCTHSGRGAHMRAHARTLAHTHIHTHTHLLSRGEIQTLLIPLAFVSPTKARL